MSEGVMHFSGSVLIYSDKDVSFHAHAESCSASLLPSWFWPMTSGDSDFRGDSSGQSAPGFRLNFKWALQDSALWGIKVDTLEGSYKVQTEIQRRPVVPVKWIPLATSFGWSSSALAHKPISILYGHSLISTEGLRIPKRSDKHLTGEMATGCRVFPSLVQACTTIILEKGYAESRHT